MFKRPIAAIDQAIMTTSKSDQPQITLYRGEANFGKHAWSSFVIKLETRFRIGNLAYKADIGSMVEAPKGKVPYVKVQQRQSQRENDKSAVSAKTTNDKSKSNLLPDSTITTSQFIREGLLEDLNQHLSPVQRTQDLACRALLEDKLYFLKVCLQQCIKDSTIVFLFYNASRVWNISHYRLRCMSPGRSTTQSSANIS